MRYEFNIKYYGHFNALSANDTTSDVELPKKKKYRKDKRELEGMRDTIE